jgi:1,2-phenylacetyl-CoA epoxidase PaaB subunit
MCRPFSHFVIAGLDPAIHQKQGILHDRRQKKALLRHCEEHLRRSNPFFLYAVRWIASLRSQ